ncbi:hypothetical protein AA313_de0202912 [Arthrobotrys entomopaga]|nr:hypothetical protein AA313_de0202912 [Arthrobotrys entomopaga]
MTTQITTSVPANAAQNPFAKALADFLANTKLSPKEQQDFQSTTAANVEVLAWKIQNEQKQRKSYRAISRLQPFIDGLTSYGGIIEVFAQTSEILCFVWGPVKLLLQIASTWQKGLDKLLDALGTIGDRLLVFEKCPDAFGNDPRVQSILVRIHSNILQFLGKALHIFRQPAARQFFETLSPTFDKKLHCVLYDLERDERTLLGIVTTTQSQRASEFYTRADIEFQTAATHRLMAARQLLRQSLNPADFPDDRLDEARTILARFPTTGQWLLQHTNFLTWAENNSPSKQVLVLHGIPGAGKTILSYLAFDDLLNRAAGRYRAHHLRLTDLPQRNNDSLGATQSLLYELALPNIEEIETVIDALDQVQTQRLKREHIIEQNLCRMMASNGFTFLFVDGLDEFKEDSEIKKFLKILENLLKQCSDLRIFLSCRMEEHIKATISTWDHFSISTTGSLLRNDLHQFVHHNDNIRVLTIDHNFNAKEAKTYLDALCAKSDGMFLYAKLILAELEFQSCNKEVEDLIQELPEGLDGAYLRSLERVNNLPKNLHPRATRVFEFLLVARRPLREAELRQAVMVEPFIESFIPKMELRQSLRALCGSLIEINGDGIVTLVHSSLKRYLLERDQILSFRLPTAHWLVGDLCLNYLSLKSIYTKSAVDYRRFIEIGEFAFLGYASENYLEHLKQGLKAQSIGANKEIDTLTGNMASILQELLRHLQEIVDDEVKCISGPAISFFRGDMTNQTVAPTDIRAQSITRSLEQEDDDHFSKSFFAMTSALMASFNKILRTIADEQIPSAKDSLQRTYGSLYRCHKHTCKNFWAGFPNSTDLDKHTAKHQMKFKCPQITCISHKIGFGTEQELRYHAAQNHRVDLLGTLEIDGPSTTPASMLGDKANLGQKLESFLVLLKDALLSKNVEWAEKISEMYYLPPGTRKLHSLRTSFQGRGKFEKLWKREIAHEPLNLEILLQICEGKYVPQTISELAAYYGSRSILRTLESISLCFALEGLQYHLSAIAIAGSNMETLQYITSREFYDDMGRRLSDSSMSLFPRLLDVGDALRNSLGLADHTKGSLATVGRNYLTEITLHLIATVMRKDEISQFLRRRWMKQDFFQQLVSETRITPYSYFSPLFVAAVIGADRIIEEMLKLPEYYLEEKEIIQLLLLLFENFDEDKHSKLFKCCWTLKSRGIPFSNVTAEKLFDEAKPIILNSIQFHSTTIEDSINSLEKAIELGIQPTGFTEISHSISSTDATEFKPQLERTESDPPRGNDSYLPEEAVARALIHLLKLAMDHLEEPTQTSEITYLSNWIHNVPKKIWRQLLRTSIQNPKIENFWGKWKPCVVTEIIVNPAQNLLEDLNDLRAPEIYALVATEQFLEYLKCSEIIPESLLQLLFEYRCWKSETAEYKLRLQRLVIKIGVLNLKLLQFSNQDLAVFNRANPVFKQRIIAALVAGIDSLVLEYTQGIDWKTLTEPWNYESHLLLNVNSFISFNDQNGQLKLNANSKWVGRTPETVMDYTFLFGSSIFMQHLCRISETVFHMEFLLNAISTRDFNLVQLIVETGDLQIDEVFLRVFLPSHPLDDSPSPIFQLSYSYLAHLLGESDILAYLVANGAPRVELWEWIYPLRPFDPQKSHLFNAMLSRNIDLVRQLVSRDGDRPSIEEWTEFLQKMLRYPDVVILEAAKSVCKLAISNAPCWYLPPLGEIYEYSLREMSNHAISPCGDVLCECLDFFLDLGFCPYGLEVIWETLESYGATFALNKPFLEEAEITNLLFKALNQGISIYPVEPPWSKLERFRRRERLIEFGTLKQRENKSPFAEIARWMIEESDMLTKKQLNSWASYLSKREHTLDITEPI